MRGSRGHAKGSADLGGALADGAPLPVPRTAGALRVGRDRLARLADATGAPVGLENLAFAFSRAHDVDAQGPFLDDLLAPTGGFLLLDVHNLWCQAVNFDCDPLALAASYPLHRVVELHVSGGSWVPVAGNARQVRRDTHDGAVPPPVLDLLAALLPLRKAARWVIVERLGDSLAQASTHAELVRDFRRVRAVVETAAGRKTASPAPRQPQVASEPAHDAALAVWQADVLEALARGDALPQATYPDYVRAADPDMVATAAALVRRWGRPTLEPASTGPG